MNNTKRKISNNVYLVKVPEVKKEQREQRKENIQRRNECEFSETKQVINLSIEEGKKESAHISFNLHQNIVMKL